MSEADIDDRRLQAWLDGELPPEEASRVEAAVAANADLQRQVARLRQAEDLLREHFRCIDDEPLPEHLQWLAGAAPSRRRALRRAAMWFLPVLSFLLGWGGHAWLGAAADAERLLSRHLLEPAAFAHGVYATDTRHPVEFPAEARRQLAVWISERMHAEIRPPRLEGAGLRFIGGRLLPSTNRMAAQFLYEDEFGRRYSLYQRRWEPGWRPLPARPRVRREEGLSVAYWQSGAFAYAIVGPDEERLERASRLLRAGGGRPL